MISTVIIDEQTPKLKHLQSRIKNLLPQIEVRGVATCLQEYKQLEHQHQPELVFVNPHLLSTTEVTPGFFVDKGKAFICISDSLDFANKPCFWEAVGYLKRPLVDRELMLAVEKAKAHLAAQTKSSPPPKESRLVGIPTMEGFEVIMVDNIVRCEGLQKCTRIVTHEKSDIISSYNIGEFKKLLMPYGLFFCPHRSHLINIYCVQKFKKAGAISLKNGTEVPLAKNRKEEFLGHINHF